MKAIIGVHHVSVSVPDIEKAREFYIDLLGAQELSAVEWGAGNDFINEIVGLPQKCLHAGHVRVRLPQHDPFDDHRVKQRERGVLLHRS